MSQEAVSSSESIEQRIAKLEKLCIRQRPSIRRILISFVLGTVTGALILNGFSVLAQSTRPNVVVATEFRLVDSSGMVRGSFGLDRGQPSLYLRDSHGNPRVSLETADDMPTLAFHRTNGQPGVLLKDNGFYLSPISGGSFLLGFAFEPYLVITDTHGRSGIELGFSHPGAMKAAMGGKPSIATESKPALAFYDNSAGEKRSAGTVIIAVGEDGNPAIKLEDQSGTTRAALGAVELQSTLNGPIERRPPSSLIFFDRDGKVIWSAP